MADSEGMDVASMTDGPVVIGDLVPSVTQEPVVVDDLVSSESVLKKPKAGPINQVVDNFVQVNLFEYILRPEAFKALSDSSSTLEVAPLPDEEAVRRMFSARVVYYFGNDGLQSYIFQMFVSNILRILEIWMYSSCAYGRSENPSVAPDLSFQQFVYAAFKKLQANSTSVLESGGCALSTSDVWNGAAGGLLKLMGRFGPKLSGKEFDKETLLSMSETACQMFFAQFLTEDIYDICMKRIQLDRGLKQKWEWSGFDGIRIRTDPRTVESYTKLAQGISLAFSGRSPWVSLIDVESVCSIVYNIEKFPALWISFGIAPSPVFNETALVDHRTLQVEAGLTSQNVVNLLKRSLFISPGLQYNESLARRLRAEIAIPLETARVYMQSAFGNQKQYFINPITTLDIRVMLEGPQKALREEVAVKRKERTDASAFGEQIIRELRKNSEELHRKFIQQKSALESAQREMANLNSQLATTSTTVAEKEAVIAQTKQRVQELDSRVTELAARNAGTLETLGELDSIVERAANGAWIDCLSDSIQSMQNLNLEGKKLLTTLEGYNKETQ